MAQNARVVVSVDLPDSPTPQEASFVQDTLALLNELNVPATWSSGVPSLNQLGRIVSSQLPHEIALATRQEWTGGNQGADFAQGLSERIDSAARHGISLRTLVAPAAVVEGRLDLLVKNRLSTLRTTSGCLSKPAELQRFGVIVAPESVDVHDSFAWWAGGPRGAVRRALHQSIQKREIAHIAIDVSRVVSAQRQAAAHAALEDAGNRIRFGLAQAATLQQLAGGHRVLRTGTGRSILRAA